MNKIANFIVEKKNIIFIFFTIILVISVIGIFNVNVNYDMSKYLPDNSEVKIGMEKMNQDFGDLSNITVMIDDLSKEERAQVQEELSNIENVKSVVFIEGDESYQKDNHTKYLVNINADTYSDEAIEVLNKIQDLYKDKTLYVSGAVVDNNLSRTTLLTEIPFIAVIAVIVIFIILFVLCDSWVEPFLFMTGIGIAVIINMGTNALLPSISFMTNAIGALLQLGLSMDYSIMLMNRYNQEKETEKDNKEAMKKALINSFKTITSSSVTTIVGLLVLAFMSFKIGQDMGIVLAKGVLISLICIFTILPGLIITFDKLIQKTKKKSIKFNMTGIMKAVTKCRFVIVPVVIVLVIGSFFMKDALDISFVKTFDNPDQAEIENVFGVENQVVLLYSKDENKDNISSYIDWLEKQDNVTEVQDYSNTIRKEYTYSDLAKNMNMDENQAKMLFQLCKDKDTNVDDMKLSLEDFINYIAEDIMTNETYSKSINQEMKAQIEDGQKQLQDNKELMLGNEYNRMVITYSCDIEGKDTFEFINNIKNGANGKFENEIYFIGDSSMAYEMNQGFNGELNFVTALSIIAIFIVVLFTFKSVLCSLVLVASIQGAVMITTAIVGLQGMTVNYIALILVQCILMGATIDYGILYLNNYREIRKSKDKKSATIDAMNNSIKTILTSSLILIGCCLSVGFVMSQKIISQTTMIIAIGTLCAVIMMVFVLPALVLLLDRFLIKTRN